MHTLYICLDTETSGLSPQTGEVIEIAAISFNCLGGKANQLSSFSSLVKNTAPLPSRVSQLTGIAEANLATAKTRIKVQDEWANWFEGQVENATRVIVIGHSLVFDLNFLTAEGWFLPESIECIDTLPLSKIVYHTKAACNLEYLAKNLNLQPSASNADKSNLSKGNLNSHIAQNPEKNSFHRALYDCKITINLFLLLLKQLKQVAFEANQLALFNTLFLPKITGQELQKASPSEVEQNLAKLKEITPILSEALSPVKANIDFNLKLLPSQNNFSWAASIYTNSPKLKPQAKIDSVINSFNIGLYNTLPSVLLKNKPKRGLAGPSDRYTETLGNFTNLHKLNNFLALHLQSGGLSYLQPQYNMAIFVFTWLLMQKNLLYNYNLYLKDGNKDRFLLWLKNYTLKFHTSSEFVITLEQFKEYLEDIT